VKQKTGYCIFSLTSISCHRWTRASLCQMKSYQLLHYFSSIYIADANRSRATFSNSQNLFGCRQLHVLQLKKHLSDTEDGVSRYGRRTRNKPCARWVYSINRRGDRGPRDEQARPSTSFVDTTIDLPWRNFVSSLHIERQSSSGVTLIFEGNLISL